MNFVGHAVIAAERDHRVGFVLGAMLPDFATMCGTRLVGCDRPAVASGIGCHHDTDREFHGLREFRDTTSQLTGSLRDLGVRRGPARAAAHVGFELILDGFLVRERPRAEVVFRDAVAHGGQLEVQRDIRWRDPAADDRFGELVKRLADPTALAGYADVDVVTDRVTRVLSHRPLLSLSDDERAPVRHVLSELTTVLPPIAARIITALAAS